MNYNRANSQIISLCLSLALVLVMFIGIPVNAKAADATLGLSAPDRAWWEVNTEGNTGLTGRGEWTPVNAAVRYHWELYWIDSLNNHTPQNPDTDSLVTSGFTVGTIEDFADSIYSYDKYGIYYFIVCAMDEDDDIGLNGIRQYTNSDNLRYDESHDPNKNPDVNIGTRPSSGGSSGGGSNIPDSFVTTSSTTTTSASLTQTSSNIKSLADTAKSNGQATVRSKGTGEVTVQASAWSQLAGLSFQHDTVVNGAVEVRVTIENPATLNQDLKVSGYVTGTEAQRVGSIFNKYFANATSVMHLDQAGSWGQPVRIAVKFDLAGMNTDNLVFYSYDKTNNQYHRIMAPNYIIDSNGYTHFSTSIAGDIVVSDGPLVKK